MERKPYTLEMDLEDWELLPRDGLDKSVSSKAVEADCFDPSRILLESIDDLSKTKVPDERIIREISEPKADAPSPTITPVFMDKNKDCGLAEEDAESRWTVCDEKEEVEEEKCLNSELKRKGHWDGIRISVWGWRLTGIGTICTLGVAAAATLCILILSGRNRPKPQHEKIQFQIYSDDKNLKQMVQQATRLNHAITATRGVSMNRASISFGGSYAAP